MSLSPCLTSVKIFVFKQTSEQRKPKFLSMIFIRSNTADHQAQDVSVLSMVFESGHSNKLKKKKGKGLENPLTEKSATILNKCMENQVEDKDGGQCGNYDHTGCARCLL